MTLHTIGDCHADGPWFKINVSDTPFENIKSHGMPLTMSLLGIDKLICLDISSFYKRSNPICVNPTNKIPDIIEKQPYNQYFNIKDGDAVAFCFGEIDVREIFAHPQYSDTWKEMIDIAVSLYFEAIKVNAEKFNHLYIMVDNIIPVSRDKDLGSYPKRTIDADRKTATLYMNSKLKEYCKKYNYTFIDVYDKYCEEDGYLNQKYSDHYNHINDPIYYVEFLNNLKF